MIIDITKLQNNRIEIGFGTAEDVENFLNNVKDFPNKYSDTYFLNEKVHNNIENFNVNLKNKINNIMSSFVERCEKYRSVDFLSEKLFNNILELSNKKADELFTDFSQHLEKEIELLFNKEFNNIDDLQTQSNNRIKTNAEQLIKIFTKDRVNNITMEKMQDLFNNNHYQEVINLAYEYDCLQENTRHKIKLEDRPEDVFEEPDENN